MSNKYDSNIDELLNIEQKKEILKEIEHEDLLSLFKDYKPKYKPIERKRDPLDQKISVGITAEERQDLSIEIAELKRVKAIKSISALIRNRAMGQIDIEDWRERAILGLGELQKDIYNSTSLKREIRNVTKLLDDLGYDDDEESEEDRYTYETELAHLESALSELERPSVRRGYRISGRVTLSEANHIRWRAARLNITVADYMRFLIFGHRPFTEADKHLSAAAKKRFYISVIDVAENGWGEPPQVEECGVCVRYQNENIELQRKLDRLTRTVK